MREILRVFEVRGLPLMIPTISKLPQEELRGGYALGDSEMIQLALSSVDADPRAPVPNSYLDRNFCHAEDDAPAHVDPGGVEQGSVDESGPPFPLPSGIRATPLNHPSFPIPVDELCNAWSAALSLGMSFSLLLRPSSQT